MGRPPSSDPSHITMIDSPDTLARVGLDGGTMWPERGHKIVRENVLKIPLPHFSILIFPKRTHLSFSCVSCHLHLASQSSLPLHGWPFFCLPFLLLYVPPFPSHPVSFSLFRLLVLLLVLGYPPPAVHHSIACCLLFHSLGTLGERKQKRKHESTSAQLT